MQIDISQDDYDRLAKHADAAGYADVPAFISALASEPIEDPRGILSDEDLRVSISECEKAHADIQAGGGRDFREAILEIGRKFGFELP
ncbi:hypothetical protein [Bythopirellula goksoeyrii]|nr:hypothetical protein [Bythopirellula goksoeyrii]